MAPRKRVREEMETSQSPSDTGLLEKLRNMWEFSCVMQFMFTFGKVVKLDNDFDIGDFEMECLKPQSSVKLEEIGLSLLKWISSHRGLTSENWDEYTRRQYLAKAPNRNPYGTEEEPRKFQNFDVFLKIRVLHQMTVWTFWNPDRMRERMPEEKEVDQTLWRVEELGWDREERSYFVLDDSRLYRRTEPSLPAVPKAKPKSNTLKAQAERRRASKRRRLDSSGVSDMKDYDDSVADKSGNDEELRNGNHEANTFGGYDWKCIAITSQQYHDFLATIRNGRDANEKELCKRVVEQVLPVVEKSEEGQRRKIERKQKELLNVQRLTSAKRSSRLADKFERGRQEREAAQAAEKHAAELAAAHQDEERQVKLEDERKSRMMTREQRIKDREYKRLLHEEELANMTGEARRVEAGQARGSERHLKAQIEKHKRDLEELSAAAEWVFDCSGCGVYGTNVDDGAHSIACESCNVWQHSKCLGFGQADAEQTDLRFVCKDCRQRIQDAKKPNIKLKFRASLSTSPPQVRDKRPTPGSSSALTFEAIETPAVGPIFPGKAESALSASSDLQRNGSSMPEGHVPPSRKLPGTLLASSPAFENGTQQVDGTVPSTSTNGQARLSGYTQQIPLKGLKLAYDNHQLSPHKANPSDYHLKEPLPTPNSGSTKQGLLEQTTHIPDATKSPVQRRLPSPVVNRPSMSPTQGNPDVGPVAGVPQDSSLSTSTLTPLRPPSRSAIPGQAFIPLSSTNADANGATTNPSFHPPAQLPENTAVNFTPNGNASLGQIQIQSQPLSGLSPTKHSSPHSPVFPQRAAATAKSTPLFAPSSSSPPPSSSNGAVSTTVTTTPRMTSNGAGHHSGTSPQISARSISAGGTPAVFPPTEKETLRPSPDQVRAGPMPTPSKALTPGK